MRVAFLHRDLPPESTTGVATQVHRLATALTRMGVQVDVFSNTKQTQTLPYQVIPVLQKTLLSPIIYKGPWKRLTYPWSFRELNFKGYDLVHIHGDGAFLPYSNHWLRTFYGSAFFERKFAESSRARLAQTLSWWAERRESDHCTHQSGIAPHLHTIFPKLDRVIPCMLGEDSSPFSFEKFQQPTLIHVGSLKGRKRGLQALKLWQTLRSHGHAWRLILVCPRNEALNFSTAGCDQDLEVHSQISDQHLNELYARSWLALSLSTYEGFGLPIIEALSQGCQVLSHPHLGAVDILGSHWPERLSSLDSMVPAIIQISQELAKGNWQVSRCSEIAASYQSHQVATQYRQWYDQILAMRAI